MDVSIVLVTYNRLEYTLKCLSHLLNDEDDFDLYIWDNASTDGTQEYLKNKLKDPRVKDLFLSKENIGPTAAMNHFWNRSKTELVGKIDNDCLVTPGWIKKLAQAHADIDRLGAVACWHYRYDDFNEKAASKKIREFGIHKIFRHPYVCGSGFLMKKKVYEKMGPWPEGSVDIGTTQYFIKMALDGYINGWYYPLIIQEHMDDPLSSHCLIKNDQSLNDMYNLTYTLRTNKIKKYKDRLKRRKLVLKILNHAPLDPKYYIGWRSKMRRTFPDFDRIYSRLIKV